MKHLGVIGLLTASWLACATVAAQPHGPVALTRDRRDPRWLHGRVTVEADPQAAWALLGDVHRWSDVFHDIRSVTVVSRRGATTRIAVVTDETETMRYDVTIDPARRSLESVLRDAASQVRSRLAVVDGPTPGSAVIRHSLFIEAGGLGALFVTDAYVRGEQRRILASHMRDIRRALGAGARPRSGPPNVGRRRTALR